MNMPTAPATSPEREITEVEAIDRLIDLIGHWRNESMSQNEIDLLIMLRSGIEYQAGLLDGPNLILSVIDISYSQNSTVRLELTELGKLAILEN